MLRDGGQNDVPSPEAHNLQKPKEQNLLSDWCHNPPSSAPNSAEIRVEEVQLGSQQQRSEEKGTTEPFRKEETAISSQKPKESNILC